MLVLQRKVGEKIYIGKDVLITIQDVSGERVKLAIDAPKEVRIIREELLSARENNEEAAQQTFHEYIGDLKDFFN